MTRRILKGRALWVGAALALLLTACTKSDPGPIAGTWRLNGPLPMTIQYRDGESVAMGMIEKVSYDIQGNDVIVKTESGPLAGVSTRVRAIDRETLQTELGTLRRAR